MSLSKLVNMFTEASAGEIREESPLIDFDFGTRELSNPPVLYESFGLRADETPSTMVASHISADDVLLSAFDSISFVQDSKHCNGIKKNTIETDAAGAICESELYGQRTDDGKVARSDSSDFPCFAEPSIHGEGEAEVLNEIDKIQESNDPLIVYTSSRRKSVRNTNMKLNQNESLKPSRNCRRIAKSTSALDLNSLKISRKRRSLFSKQPRSSVWGVLGNMGPAFEEQISLVPNMVNEKKQKRGEGGQEKRTNSKSHTGQKSVPKTSTSTGRISLKIKIGNQTVGTVNVPESLNALGKRSPGLSDKNEKKSGEELPGDMLLPHERSSDKVLSTVASDLGTDLNIRGCLENTSLGTSNDLHQTNSHEDVDNLRTSTGNRCSDAGTSPDSEVINSVPDAPLIEKGSQTMNDAPMMLMEGKNQECSIDSVPYVSFGDVESLRFTGMNCMEGKKKDKRHLLGDCIVESKLTREENPSNAKTRAELGLGQKVVNVSYCNDASMIATAEPYLDANNSNEFSMDPSNCSRMLDSGNPSSTSQFYTGAEMNPSSRLASALESSKSQADGTLISCNNGQKSPKFSRGKGGRKIMSGTSNLPDKKDKASKKNGAKNNLLGKYQINEKGDANDILSGLESHLTAGNQASSDHGVTEDGVKNLNGQISNSQFSSAGISNQYVPPRNAWVLCDACQKWRRIPAILADQIEETNRGWTCKENTDKDFADCSIPQEKSNSEINEELEISDASCEEDACDTLLKSNKNRSKAAQQSSFSLIKSNLFLHRNRKTQTIDEVMVCHCKPPPDGRMGCGAKCLNRMLNIECVQGTCPCGERCSNQQFQKRKYAKLKWFRCGKKGFGLQALQDISSGQFLIEYVGEVLDMHAYEARQKEYAVQGHKHFYFMTLNGSEVIDASAKGNLGRFINHSCDPNCRTEKWMVNGEVCVGLFAVRDIKKGEEVTFDYNFVRVFGAAAKKCVCGSPNCRGYIGGDPTSSEVVQEDSDDEFAEPVMTCEDREMNEDWKDILLNCLHDRESVNANELQENGYRMKELVDDAGQFETVTSETLFQKVGGNPSTTDGCSKTPTPREVKDMMVQDKSVSVDNDSAFNDAVRLLAAKKDTGASSKSSVSAAAADDAALPSKLEPNTTESKRKLKYGIVQQKEDLLKSDPLVKTRSPSSSIKKGKLKFNVVNDKGTRDMDKSNAVLHKSKKLPDISVNSHVEAVEEKLNELLNKEGGISKRNDASRGYLKLLFLTAASGTNGHGEAIQSNRDLSMILDALLKTKSRTVLADITNKNGLQMLHNIMKRYRKEFTKTPILRKLLKVLEYLAMREILTLEHITGGPPCPGVESFKDSILTLTEHADKQVHQIARNFRDRYIPRSLRRSCFVEMDDLKMGTHHHSSYGRLSASSHDHWGDRGGKPAESGSVDASTQVHSTASGSASGTNGNRIRKRKSRWDNPEEDHLHPRSRCDVDEDIPPGFLPPCNPSTVPFDKVLGNPQQRFIARVPLSYGVPVSVVQQFRVLQAEIAKGWTVAPGLPFHPFPPLPPYAKCAPSSEPEEKAEQGNDACIPRVSGQKRNAPCSMGPPGANSSEREGGSNNLGRRYFRQQKWNHSKLAPPWVRMRNHGWGHSDGRNQFRNSYNSEEFN